MADEPQPRSRARLWVLAVAVLSLAAAAVQHQVHFWRWYIEDAAISFAYARNWADGHGLVPTPDTERLEGYSNFTWVALLALGELLGFDSFDSSKTMQVVLGFLTVILTALLAREASPSRTDGTPIAAAAYLATASTFAVWGACGLENSLFNFLMAAALLRSAIELRTEANTPWSAFLWFLLAVSRPEAVLYCAIAGFWMMVFTLRRGVMPTLKWLGWFFVPFVAYHALRFNYFAYEFPQTYYGKMTNKEPTPLAWRRRGWKQVRGWSHTLWTGYYLPIWFLGLVGWRGAKGLVTLLLLLICGCTLLFPEIIPLEPLVVGDYEIAPILLHQDFPLWWEDVRSYMMVFCAVFLPIVALGDRPGWGAWSIAIGLWGVAPFILAAVFVGTQVLGMWSLLTVVPGLVMATWFLAPSIPRAPLPTQVRVLCWGVASGVFFFAIYTQGDWMKAWRWMSLLQVPIAVAFATGVASLGDLIDTGVGKLNARFPGVPNTLFHLTFWSLVLLLGVSLAVFDTPKFPYGPNISLSIVVGALVLALVLGLAHRPLQMPWKLSGWTVVAALCALTAFPNLHFTHSLNQRPETGPFSVKKRVDFVETVRDKLELEHRIVDLDVDMGAHLWWGRDTFRMMDLAGLVDIPFAQHRFKRAFVKEYLYEEMRPHFAHVHGGWSTNSRIKTFPHWKENYLEIPGFGGRVLHIGNYVRRDLFLRDTYPHGEPIAFTDGVTFHGFRIPSEPGANRTLWLEVAVQDAKRRLEGAPLQLLVLVASEGELKTSWSVPLGYDWMLRTDWKAEEIFIGNFDLSTRGLEPGDYDLGFVLHAEGAPLVREDLAPNEDEEPEWVFAKGEIWFPSALTVVPADQALKLAAADRADSLREAAAGDCEAAAESWQLATRHVPINKTFKATHRTEIHAAIASCWSKRAQDAEEPLDALRQARLWNHLDPLYRELRTEVATDWMERGTKAREHEDWEAAYTAFSTVLSIDPTWSWARRWAEEARSERLDLATADRKGR